MLVALIINTFTFSDESTDAYPLILSGEFPQMAVSSDGYLHVVYVRTTDSGKQVVYYGRDAKALKGCHGILRSVDPGVQSFHNKRRVRVLRRVFLETIAHDVKPLRHVDNPFAPRFPFATQPLQSNLWDGFSRRQFLANDLGRLLEHSTKCLQVVRRR